MIFGRTCIFPVFFLMNTKQCGHNHGWVATDLFKQVYTKHMMYKHGSTRKRGASATYVPLWFLFLSDLCMYVVWCHADTTPNLVLCYVLIPCCLLMYLRNFSCQLVKYMLPNWTSRVWVFVRTYRLARWESLQEVVISPCTNYVLRPKEGKCHDPSKQRKTVWG
jgi:hypothetical protein